jgi:hypothetical protein
VVTYFRNGGDRIDVACTWGTGQNNERLCLIRHIEELDNGKHNNLIDSVDD